MRWQGQHQATTSGVDVRWLPGWVSSFVGRYPVRQAGGSCGDLVPHGVNRDLATSVPIQWHNVRSKAASVYYCSRWQLHALPASGD